MFFHRSFVYSKHRSSSIVKLIIGVVIFMIKSVLFCIKDKCLNYKSHFFTRRISFHLLFFLIFYFCSITTAFSSYGLYEKDINLSNNAILSMHQDKTGYMWFGTYDGLTLYDSKNVQIYRFEIDSKLTLCSNIIQKITDADTGYLWISTSLGLNKFSLKEKKVIESHPEYPEARLLACDSLGNTVTIVKENFISYYSPQKRTFQDFYSNNISPDKIKNLFWTATHKLYALTDDANLIEIKLKDIHSPEKTGLSINQESIHDKKIVYSFYDNNTLYIVDSDKRLYLYDTDNRKKIFIKDLSSLIDKYGSISQIVNFHKDIFIAFKSSGLIKLKTSEGFNSEPVTLKIGIFSLLKDKKQDILWVGTDGLGVQMYYEKDNLFENITLDQIPQNLHKPVRAIYTDEYHNLWIGTKGDGIIRISDYENTVKNNNYAHNITRFTNKDGLSDNQVFCFLRSHYKNIIWIGTEGPGLSYYSYEDKQIHTIEDKSGQQIKKVHSICEVGNSTLWIATAGEGLLEIQITETKSDIEIESIKKYTFEKNNNICNEFHSLSYNGGTDLFVGCRGGFGVVRLNVISKQYEFIPMNNTERTAIGDVLSVYQTKDSTIYIGSSSGLTKLKLMPQGQNMVKHFDRRSGIANDMIHGILEDKNGYIWLSTNKGLVQYNPKNDFFHNYYSDLKVTEFSDDAYWFCPQSKRLFWGGTNGLVWLYPEESKNTKYRPNLNFLDIKFPGNNSTQTRYLNEKSNKLELPAKMNSFSISFIAIDYINGSDYEYSYIIEGYTPSWKELQNDNEVVFTNLPPGNYTLKVKFKNDVLDSDYYSLNITILPPWYLSIWAITCYIIGAILLLLGTAYYLKIRIQRRQLAIANKIKEEQKEKLLETKLNFFTNITHELYTPLTLINGVCEQILEYSIQDDKLSKYTNILNNNVNNLNELIQEILDFRKIENSEFNSKSIKRTLISEIINNQLVSFTHVANQTSIKYTATVPDNLYWNTDEAYFKKIFTNLISNAFKYTSSGGLIKIEALIKNNSLIISIYNTGQGIEESQKMKIFDRYYILDNIEKNGYAQMTSSNGLGLLICYSLVKLLGGDIKVNSEINEYAEFVVTLPFLEIDNEIPETTTTETLLNKTESQPYEITTQPTILVVDDNREIVWLISQILSSDYIIKEANDASEALKMVENITPSLIILDIMMPEIDGLELTKRLRANKFTKHIPILIVSAKVTAKEQAEAYDAGANTYLTKPFSSELLRSVVHRMLTSKGELKEYYDSPESAYEYSEGKLVHQEDKSFMEDIISIIEENIENETLRPELIAGKLGISSRSLYRKVKKITLMPPSDFIKDYKLIYAAKLLINTNLTVKEITYKVGISNKSHFYREFLKKYEMTPNDYRKHKS